MKVIEIPQGDRTDIIVDNGLNYIGVSIANQVLEERRAGWVEELTKRLNATTRKTESGS